MDSFRLVDTPEALGEAVRMACEGRNIPLREAAPRARVGVRFLSELERGKPTAELAKVLDALRGSGLDLAVVPRSEAREETPPPEGYAQHLGLEFPYDWANRRMEAATFIRKVLEAGRFQDILRVVGYFGMERVSREVRWLQAPEQRESMAGILSRIFQGMLLATGGADDAATDHTPA